MELRIVQAGLKWPRERIHTRPASDIRYIVVHHTDSGPRAGAEQLHRQHLARGWAGLGYHYLVYEDGVVVKARQDLWVPACVAGFNRQSLCVALVGSFRNVPPSDQHLQAAATLLRALKSAYPGAEVVRHRDLNPTECPGAAFPWRHFLALVGPQVVA